jgi:hypothetical protein
MNGKYILDGKIAVECHDLKAWAKWYETGNRRVADETINGMRVSTVFLSLDHSFGEGPPMLFETMVFGGPLDQEQDRCATWDQAEAMHKAMVYRVKEQVTNKITGTK